MINKYRLSKPLQCDGFTEQSLYECVGGQGVFEGYRQTPSAVIHVSDNDGKAFIMAPGIPISVAAQDFDHALNFCRAILSITDLERDKTED